MRPAILAVVLAVLMGSSLVTAQQPSEPPKSAVINFFVEVNTNSLNALITLVDNQVRSGTKRVTLLISSIGGDPAAAFTAYNYLRGVPIELTTFNVGNVDSAASVLYCAGTKRYSLPGTRFLLHGVAVPVAANTALNGEALENNLALVKNQNQMISRVIADNSKKKESEIEGVLRGQTILNPDEAKAWGLVQEVKTEFLEPGAVMVTFNAPLEPPLPPAPKFKTLPTSPIVPEWHGVGIATDSKPE